MTPLQAYVDALGRRLMQPSDREHVDFRLPAGEPALIAHDSLSWRIFKNPLALFVGGIAAVILELAEPAVRSGVWDHTSFRTDPLRRLQRTGLAAMITVYGPRSLAKTRIAGVVRMHERIAGSTPAGERYQANDVNLLNWVQATASFGFAAAYSRFVSPLSDAQMSQIFAEGIPAARLYGAVGAPCSSEEWNAELESMRDRLEASPIVIEFLSIMSTAPILPWPLRPLQKMMVRAAVEITPEWVRERLGLGARWGLNAFSTRILRYAGVLADRIVLPSSPAVQSCLRLGLPASYLSR